MNKDGKPLPRVGAVRYCRAMEAAKLAKQGRKWAPEVLGGLLEAGEEGDQKKLAGKKPVVRFQHRSCIDPSCKWLGQRGPSCALNVVSEQRAIKERLPTLLDPLKMRHVLHLVHPLPCFLSAAWLMHAKT